MIAGVVSGRKAEQLLAENDKTGCDRWLYRSEAGGKEGGRGAPAVI